MALQFACDMQALPSMLHVPYMQQAAAVLPTWQSSFSCLPKKNHMNTTKLLHVQAMLEV
jgi:hypothetical protein